MIGERISVPLARALRDSGLPWHPIAGDAFVIDRVEVDDQVFILSDMTIEAHDYPTGTVLGFNGTIEWALDSVAKADALWLPSEAQLRALLGPAFESLRAGWVVTATIAGVAERFEASTAVDAYARALLRVLDGITLDD